MRVIAGSARGVMLNPLPRHAVIRPTLDRVREALFSILTPRLTGAAFLDLFAGTGANGIEALSRGAARATFVDSDRALIELIQKNLEKTRLAANARVVQATLPRDLSRIPGGPYDIVFADPPYAFHEWPETMTALVQSPLVAESTLIVYEHSPKTEPPESAAPFTLRRTRTYGDTALSFYEKS